MAVAFGALALVAGLAGDAAVAAPAGVAWFVTAVLSALAPRLAGLMNPPRDVR